MARRPHEQGGEGGGAEGEPAARRQDWETAYWRNNFARLRKIKAKYDPQNVFQYDQSVPPAVC
nr:BBE domain-containing protein [Streptomyces adustus]